MLLVFQTYTPSLCQLSERSEALLMLFGRTRKLPPASEGGRLDPISTAVYPKNDEIWRKADWWQVPIERMGWTRTREKAF